MTQASIQNISWLGRFEQVKVTPRWLQDETLNPEYERLYENPDPEQRSLVPAQFIYYDLNTEAKYGFQGASLGHDISARQILMDFSDEPDWGMDKKLQLALSQNFMGGSHGYRHMYYPSGAWHLPHIFSAQGTAIQRLIYFYQSADQAFTQGDMYWGLRFLARAVHYIQDLAQPYHTTQTSWAFFHVSSPLKATTETTKNYHFAYESLVAYLLEQESAGWLPANYQLVFEEAMTIPAESVEDLALKIAKRSHQLSKKTFDISVEIFGDKLFADHPVPLTASDVETILKHPKRPEFDRIAKQALELVAVATKGLLGLADRDFSLGRVK